uniref:PCI domain-containing protein n=1 Tax=Chlamydomonas euryale TaxID=1486919 RepID=A0A7R9V1V3_9CHLO|mmetsp:Transcript_1354/g.3678  ORF Transcript_1354/g.3678 Transcript_1354/m.3678 type:complete len:422 (+) Transcript_1354:120-1385(+)
MAPDLEAQLKAGEKLAETDIDAAVSQMKGLVLDSSCNDADAVKVKEQTIQKMCDLLVKNKDATGLSQLLSQFRDFFNVIPKAKTAKIVRSIIDSVAKIPGSTQLQVNICKEQMEWAKTEKRTFLRQRIELRLASLFLDTKSFQDSLGIIGTLLSEVKKLDDKLLLVDIFLLESKVHYALRNMPKARAALTSARTAANSIYVPLLLQAEIDCQSGILHAEEKDYKTAYSYFFESFEQLNTLDEPKAVTVLKYMLLAKIMLNQADDVPSIISSKAGLKHTGEEVDAMRAVAKAYHDRSLQTFQAVTQSYKAQLVEDAIIHSHLSALYDTLLEQNLVRLIEPFSRVEIAHVASLIDLPVGVVEIKLSQMILDKKLVGTLDQGAGCLEVFEEPTSEAVYPTALEVIESMGRVVDTLFTRSHKVVV